MTAQDHADRAFEWLAAADAHAYLGSPTASSAPPIAAQCAVMASAHFAAARWADEQERGEPVWAHADFPPGGST